MGDLLKVRTAMEFGGKQRSLMVKLEGDDICVRKNVLEEGLDLSLDGR